MTTANSDVITDFSGEFDFLHNAYPSLIFVDGEAYPSVEHAFQACKTDDPDLRKQISAADVHTAKKIGRKVLLQNDWDDSRWDIMYGLIYQKFSTHFDLKLRLLQTQHREFKTFQDTFWGVDVNGVGENNIGVILSSVRDKIRTAEGSAWKIFMEFLSEKNLGFVEKELSDQFYNDSNSEFFNKWS